MNDMRSQLSKANSSGMADMLSAIDESRFRIVSIPESAIIGLFNAAFDAPGSLSVPVFDGLPDGYFVDGCQPDPMRRALIFQVYHPSFDPVACSTTPPDLINPLLATITVKFAAKQPTQRH